MANLFDRLRGVGGKPKPPAEPARTKLEAELDREQARELVSRKVQAALEHFDGLIQKSAGIDHSIATEFWNLRGAGQKAGASDQLKPYINDGEFKYVITDGGREVKYQIFNLTGKYDDKKGMEIFVTYNQKGGGDFDNDDVFIGVKLHENRPGDYSDCEVVSTRGRLRLGKVYTSLHVFNSEAMGCVAAMARRSGAFPSSEEVKLSYKDTTHDGGIRGIGGTLSITNFPDPTGTENFQQYGVRQSKPIANTNNIEWGNMPANLYPRCKVQDGFLVVNSNAHSSSEDSSFPLHTTIPKLLEDLAPGFFTPNGNNRKNRIT